MDGGLPRLHTVLASFGVMSGIHAQLAPVVCCLFLDALKDDRLPPAVCY